MQKKSATSPLSPLSYGLSCLLHIGLIALILLWPSSPPVNLNRQFMQISLTMGAPGGDNLPSPVLGHTQKTTAPPKEASTAAVNTPEPKKQEVPQKTEPKPAPKTEAIQVKEPKKEAPAKKESPAEKSPPKKESPQKAPEKAKPEPRPEAKPEPKAEAKPIAQKADTKPKEAPKAATQKPLISPKESLQNALADAAKQTGTSQAAKAPVSPIAGALASLEGEAAASNRPIGGGGGVGDGPGGGGLYDVYTGMVILAVRPNWSMPTYSRENLIVHVRVVLDANGLVQTASIEQSSGRADFDASAVNAVIRTKQLPKPPSPAHQELVIAFNALEMAGR